MGIEGYFILLPFFDEARNVDGEAITFIVSSVKAESDKTSRARFFLKKKIYFLFWFLFYLLRK